MIKSSEKGREILINDIEKIYCIERELILLLDEIKKHCSRKTPNSYVSI